MHQRRRTRKKMTLVWEGVDLRVEGLKAEEERKERNPPSSLLLTRISPPYPCKEGRRKGRRMLLL
jgi:hypothetical protein